MTADNTEKAEATEVTVVEIKRRRPPFATVLRRWLPMLAFAALLGVVATLAVQRCADAVAEPETVFIPAPPPSDPAITVTLSYPLISALIQRGIDNGESPIALKNIESSNSNGRLLIRGTAQALGQNVGATVELEPFVENSVIRLRVKRARLGRIPVPSNVERLAEGPLNRELAASLSNLPASLTSVAVTDGGLTVTADVRIDELQFTPR